MQVYMLVDLATVIGATPRRARVTAAVLERLRRRAHACAPAECCGLLIGSMTADVVDVLATVDAPNAAPDPIRRFAIPAATVLAAQRAAATTGLDVVGFYHSHPRGLAAPSHDDIEGAPPGYLHVIVSPGGVRAWWRAEPDHPLAEVLL